MVSFEKSYLKLSFLCHQYYNQNENLATQKYNQELIILSNHKKLPEKHHSNVRVSLVQNRCQSFFINQFFVIGDWLQEQEFENKRATFRDFFTIFGQQIFQCLC